MRLVFARGATLLGIALTVVACSDPCANTIKAERSSPDGKYVATAFIRDCGATTSFSPQVDLRPAGQTAGRTGNVFVGNRSDSIDIEWVSPSRLVVYTDGVVVKHEAERTGVRIEKRGLKP